jgi:hypothetical protein
MDPLNPNPQPLAGSRAKACPVTLARCPDGGLYLAAEESAGYRSLGATNPEDSKWSIMLSVDLSIQ